MREGVVTRPQLYDALRLQRQNNLLLGTCLLSLGYVDADRLLATLARQLAIPALRPGSLGAASPEAVRRVPREVALRLRIVPYSWDGQMLGVAIADGRVLADLNEVAYHSQSAVGAYVALELEIGATLRRLYGGDEVPVVVATPPPPAAQNRARPVRTTTFDEIPTRDFGRALGLETLQSAAPERAAVAPIQRASSVFLAAPPAAKPRVPTFTRVGVYECVERLYEAKDAVAVGCLVGQALLNYFSRVLVLAFDAERAQAVAAAGFEPAAAYVPLSALARTVATVEAGGQRSIVYGLASSDPRATELGRALGMSGAATSLVGTLSCGRRARLVLYADNADRTDLYEELHDVELLFKEAETALELLFPGA